ncbi:MULTISPECIES: hypothetical protein [unclassified Streptomyces]|nr:MULTISPECIES: hypothetical protein [unclassified Streptomyces]
MFRDTVANSPFVRSIGEAFEGLKFLPLAHCSEAPGFLAMDGDI